LAINQLVIVNRSDNRNIFVSDGGLL